MAMFQWFPPPGGGEPGGRPESSHRDAIELLQAVQSAFVLKTLRLSKVGLALSKNGFNLEFDLPQAGLELLRVIETRIKSAGSPIRPIRASRSLALPAEAKP
jgi:hypothetical protein